MEATLAPLWLAILSRKHCITIMYFISCIGILFSLGLLLACMGYYSKNKYCCMVQQYLVYIIRNGAWTAEVYGCLKSMVACVHGMIFHHSK